MARVGLIFGGRSVEHEVSVRSARTVANALRDAGHEIVALGVALDGCWVDDGASRAALGGELSALESVGLVIAPSVDRLLHAELDVAFPLIHGTFGEDGSLQGLLEVLGVPYVGADVAASAIAMDKVLCKRQLEAHGIPVVEYETVSAVEWESDPVAAVEKASPLGLPAFVKPSVGGSSVGVRKVSTGAELGEAIRFALAFDDCALVERAVVGRELECAVLGYPKLEASVVGEVVAGREFYDYEDKYLSSAADLRLPAELPTGTATRVRDLAIAAFAAVSGTGMARVDFLLEGSGALYVNEINTLPGFTEISMYPKLWALSGVPVPELVDRLVQQALDRARDQSLLQRSARDWITGL